ncbi:MAG: hypothetical protein QY311_00755 [Candidatus Paceibacterota bacterium]|nr:MAG: hypothetical protein QY311_00755 [Candidatus Paceibacterota bacterium]
MKMVEMAVGVLATAIAVCGTLSFFLGMMAAGSLVARWCGAEGCPMSIVTPAFEAKLAGGAFTVAALCFGCIGVLAA